MSGGAQATGVRQDGPMPCKTVRLVVSDIDGTLIGPDKRLTVATLSAARDLARAGIALCLVSSRSPEGMTRYRRELDLTTLSAGMNGAMIVAADGAILESLELSRDAVSTAFDTLIGEGVDTWLFRGHDWLVRDRQTHYVHHEEEAVGITAEQVDDLGPYFSGVGKIMGASADAALLERLEGTLGERLEQDASVHCSSSYYLDITHKDANKGYAARHLAARYGLDMAEVACIGDMTNDIAMLSVAGLAIAMGQSSERVKRNAHVVAASNAEDGWARAMQQFVLPRAPKN